MRPASFFASLAVLAASSGNAHAYLDPGTGSIILQAVIATVASSLFVVKVYWHKLKSLLGIGRNSAASEDESDPGKR